jgi:menaquinone-dependent protoporphyrinogen oxidase
MAARAPRLLVRRRLVGGVLAAKKEPMRALVAVATKHGATAEIAEVLSGELADHGLDVKVLDMDDVDDLDPYGAVVLGSAIYAGQWLKAARRFVDEHGEELADRPTWLFSSGPLGDPPRPAAENAVHLESILAVTGARGHRVFAGKLDKTRLSFPERAIAFTFRAADGDFRDLDAVRAWACEIALELGRPVRSRAGPRQARSGRARRGSRDPASA